MNLEGLNEAQRRAVCTDREACLVLAGPGSGKTHTITERIRFLIYERGVTPEKILVITFTKEAAVSMQERFLKKESGCGVVFGTFHSVFYQILRLSGGYSQSKILTESGKRSIISKIITDILPGYKKQRFVPNDITSSFLSAISEFKNSADKGKALRKLSKEYITYYDIVFEKYEEVIRRQKMLDYDDMIYECHHLLSENPDILDYWSGRFSHILIDEYQDINPFQFKCACLLKGKDTCIFAVGDDDQSIYGFRGGGPDCLKDFLKEYNAEIINLTYNYRSGETIVKFTQEVISNNKNRLEKSQVSAKDNTDSGRVEIKSFESKKAQYEHICDYLSGREKEHIGVLFRTNISMQSFAKILTEKGIAFKVKEKTRSIYEHSAAADVFAYLEAAETGDLGALLRIINKPLRFISREMVSEEKDPIGKAILYLKEHSDHPFAKEKLEALYKLKKDLNFLKDKPLYLRASYILGKIGLREYYEKTLVQRSVLSEYLSVLDFILEDSKKYESLQEWKERAEEYKENYETALNIRLTEGDLGINIMTVHASKGLEFETVIIPDVNEGNFPCGKMQDTDLIEEERRVFYVALSRAKENLFIYYISGKDGREKPVSRFIGKFLKSLLF